MWLRPTITLSADNVSYTRKIIVYVRRVELTYLLIIFKVTADNFTDCRNYKDYILVENRMEKGSFRVF